LAIPAHHKNVVDFIADEFFVLTGFSRSSSVSESKNQTAMIQVIT
jgi:hypothetical protein